MTQETDARCNRLLDVLFNPRDKEEVRNSILYHLMSLQGRDPERAGSGDMYKAIAYMMRDSLVEKWLKTQRESAGAVAARGSQPGVDVDQA